MHQDGSQIAERSLDAGREGNAAEDRQYAQQLAEDVKRHSPATFYGFDDPVEAAVFSVLVEILKKIDPPV
jgi:general stress protein YciG